MLTSMEKKYVENTTTSIEGRITRARSSQAYISGRVKDYTSEGGQDYFFLLADICS